ncbi:MAG: hypothetical protein QOJ29_1851 [Thermoleophilaceae bacterium]|nr:hypothetical protein [Thermoleophilaceae bacterium]
MRYLTDIVPRPATIPSMQTYGRSGVRRPVLELDVTAPEAGAELITDYSVEYTEETDFGYATVTILGVIESIEVQHAH